MAFRATTLRYAVRTPLPSPRLPQRRWARVQDIRLLATHSSQERILAKYKEKLESKVKEQGLRDLEELKEQYKEKIETLRKQAIVPGATGPLTPPPSPPSSPLRPTSQTQKSSWPSPPPPPTPQSSAKPAPPPGVKTLSSFLDVDKVRALPQKEIEALWRIRHASNPQSIHFAVPAATFTKLLQTAKQHPAFVLPLPREIPVDDAPGVQGQGEGKTTQAAELHYLQFSTPHPDTTTLLFTSLAAFKLHGEFAPPHTTITFHQELADSHNLVLGQGSVMENRGVSIDDARWLVLCMQKFYVQGTEGEGRGELLRQFTMGDAGFRVERLMEEAERAV